MWDMASNYTGTMIGYHAVPVIVDAYMKGDRNFDIQEAYRACVRAAEYDTTGIKCPDLVLPHLMPKAKYYKTQSATYRVTAKTNRLPRPWSTLMTTGVFQYLPMH